MNNQNLQRILNCVNVNDQESINAYIQNLNVSNNTKRMYAYLVTKYLESNGLEYSKINHYDQEFKTCKNDLTYDEVQCLKSHLWDDEINFIFNALLETGMRIQEFVNVKWELLNQCQIPIKTIKNKNEFRNVFISKNTLDILLKLKSIFFDFSKINIKRIQYLLSKLGKLANLTISLSPHVLRRTKGSLLRMNGAALEDIADILGHRNLETTRKYYSKLNAQYLNSVSKLSEIKPVDSIEIQRLIEENKLLKKQIILLTEELENEKRKNN